MPKLQGPSPVGRDEGDRSYTARTTSRVGPDLAMSWGSGGRAWMTGCERSERENDGVQDSRARLARRSRCGTRAHGQGQGAQAWPRGSMHGCGLRQGLAVT